MRRLALLLALGGCADPVTAIFADPGVDPGADFYALPFPNDRWREPDGTIDLSQFPTNGLLVETYRAAAEELDGFGLNQPVFARFEGALDPDSLPTPAESVDERASVYLVDVDPRSPDRGGRVPVHVRFHAAATPTIGGNRLVVRPYPGFGLTSGTTYAAVITDRARAASGGDVLAPASFQALLDGRGDPALAAAYEPLLAWLDEPGGDDRDDVVSAAVFTTQRAMDIAPAIRKGVFGTPAPEAANVMEIPLPTPMPLPLIEPLRLFVGEYTAPSFQRGDVPYRNAPAGKIVVGPDGAAIVQRMEPMRFGLSIPVGPMPAAGWPIAIYQHGTGGDHLTFVEDLTSHVLAAQGIAVISTDQVLHGPRNPGGDAELDFFNISNPYAMRDNSLQGAADAWSQLRLALRLSIPDGKLAIRFDPSRVYFFGHSQGGSTGPAFVALEPAIKGAVLSGTAGLLSLSLLYKTNPLDVPSLLQTFLRDGPVDEDNPSLALCQMWFEHADGINYAPLMVRRPGLAPDGTPLAPRNIFQTEGFTDTYTPNPAIEAMAVAIGGDLVQTPDQQDVSGLTELRGRAVLAPPFSGNASGVTAVLAQYRARPGEEGHYVVFDIPLAVRQSAEFLGTLSRTGTATIVEPAAPRR
jgi:predicted esterase